MAAGRVSLVYSMEDTMTEDELDLLWRWLELPARWRIAGWVSTLVDAPRESRPWDIMV
jgi:hypothetical protein